MSNGNRGTGRLLGGSTFLIGVCFVLPVLLLDQLGRALGSVGGPLV